jgi:uncharacterized membrane protein YjjB (DUF3815 family)
MDTESGLILAYARVLFENGQSTEQTVASAELLGRARGQNVTLLPRWGELELRSVEGDLLGLVPAAPTGIDMGRVVAATRAADQIASGKLCGSMAGRAIAAAAQEPPAPTWLFALASGTGAVALAVIFGLEHLAPAVLTFASASAGAFLRREIAKLSTNLFVQPFCAAVLAGIVGALAARLHLSSSLRLVAVCPCMILVPGPYFLNGALDLMSGRVQLGIARLTHAILVVAAIATGLLFGLALLGVTLPVEPPGRAVALWQDVIAAGVAVACYSVFFSTPLRMLPWPVAIGMVGHALRWLALTYLGFGPAAGAFVACLAVGLVLSPVSYESRMPFAAIGFASVVSMIPGVYLFRTASGLTQIAGGNGSDALIVATIATGAAAVLIVLAMSIGLIVPKLTIDGLGKRSAALIS